MGNRNPVAALAAAVMIGQPATAQEWSVTVGGFFVPGVGYVDAGDDPTGRARHQSGMEVVADAEVHVTYRLTADNGLTFGTRVEFEANDEFIDEYVAKVSGSFGVVEIGVEDGAGDRLLLTPPGCNLSCAGDGDGFLFDYSEDAAGDAIDNDGQDSGDDFKVIYFTPSFAGFRAGVSYGPAGDDSGTSSDSSRDDDHLEIGARLDIDLSEMMGDPAAELALSGAYFSVNGLEDDSVAVAAELDAYGFGVGGRYAYLDADDESNFSVGVEYGTGPWTGGVNYTQVVDSDVRENDFAISVEINYALAPGVTLAGVAEYADYAFTDPDADFEGGFALGALAEFDF